MGQVVNQIQIFNKAFKVAWDLAVEQSELTPGLGPKISDEIRRLMKGGQTDPDEVGKAAFEALKR